VGRRKHYSGGYTWVDAVIRVGSMTTASALATSSRSRGKSVSRSASSSVTMPSCSAIGNTERHASTTRAKTSVSSARPSGPPRVNWGGSGPYAAGISHHTHAPARAEDLSNLPPAYIDVGELDIFSDEDLVYARGLTAAGVPTELHIHRGAPHAFEIFAPKSGVAQTCNRRPRAAPEVSVTACHRFQATDQAEVRAPLAPNGAHAYG
jgi:acetyl esterase/lipase